MPAKKQTKLIKKSLPPVKPVVADPELDVEAIELPNNDSESPEEVMQRMADEHAQAIGSMLLSMEADSQNFYNIRMKAGRCIIERLGVSPALVMEDNLHDALKVISGAK